MGKLLEAKDLTLGYPSGDVIKDLNFTVDSGDLVCVVGPNGAGKSTLIKGLLGLIKPRHGEIVYHNLVQKFIGYMPQETKVDADFPASVEEIVLSGTLNKSGWRPFYSDEQRQKASEALKTLRISSLKDRHFSDLSGGQRQRVLLARALAATSKLLVLDEPSNNLDSSSRRSLYDNLKKLNQEKGLTIIMVTHDLDHKNLIGNKILSLRTKPYFYGSTEQYVQEVHRV